MNISAVIITLNSRKYLEHVIASVRDLDEVMVFDLGSTDDTCVLATSLGAHVELFPLAGRSIERARDAAIKKSRADWIFFLEPNELATPELIDYIKRFPEEHPEAAGLFIPRKNHVLFHFVRNSYPGFRLRLMRRDGTSWPDVPGAFPEVDGKVIHIPAQEEEKAILHMSGKFEYGRDRAGRDTRLMHVKVSNGRVSLIHMTLVPVIEFFRTYIFRGAINYGKAGFIAAQRNAVSALADLTNTYVRSQRENFNKTHSVNIPRTHIDD